MLADTIAILAQAKEQTTDTILWIIAAVLVIAGIFAIIRSQVIWGIVLIVLGPAGRTGRREPAGLTEKARRERRWPRPEGPRPPHVWGDRGDLNPQPPGPQPGALTS